MRDAKLIVSDAKTIVSDGCMIWSKRRIWVFVLSGVTLQDLLCQFDDYSKLPFLWPGTLKSAGNRMFLPLCQRKKKATYNPLL